MRPLVSNAKPAQVDWPLLVLQHLCATKQSCGLILTCLQCYAGIFTPRAEITNARAAMLGFAILLLLEHKSGVPFF